VLNLLRGFSYMDKPSKAAVQNADHEAFHQPRL
jgi:hypothetical protein